MKISYYIFTSYCDDYVCNNTSSLICEHYPDKESAITSIKEFIIKNPESKRWLFEIREILTF